MQQQAAEYLAQGQYSEAIALYEQCIEANPTLMSNYWHLGLAWLLQGEESEAQAIWLSALTQGNPADIDVGMAELLKVLEAEAIRHLDNHKLQLATEIYWQILELDSDRAEAHYNLGNAIAQQGNLDEAVACWQRAIEIQPDFAEAYQNQGCVFQKLEQFEDAITCYLKALEIQPNWIDTLYNLGLCFFQQGRLDDAIACFKKTTQIQPEYAQAYSDWGYALLEKDQLDEAITCFKKAIQIKPEFAQAYCKWRDTLAKQDKSNDAINSNASLLKALHSQQETTDLYLFLRNVLARANQCQQGKVDERSVIFQQVLQVDTPKEFYESTWDWAVASNLETSNYINIYPKNIIHFTPPRTLDKTIHFSFRFGNNVELPATFVALVPDGRYWLNKGQDSSATITSANQLLADISPEFPALSPGHPDKHPSKHSIFSLGKLPPPEKIDGTVAVLSGLLNDVYFHWMLDILPRIELLHRSGIEMAGIDKFLISSRLSFQKETLNTLGIADTKILQTDKYPHIQATNLVVPSFPGSIAWMPKWACDFLRNTFLDKKAFEASEKIERLYISRSQAANRRIINEDEVISLLNKFGFKSVTLESMSVREQAALLANAKVVVAPHGGGLTNTVFCSPGTKVIEIFSPNYVYHCYWLISNIVGLDYYYLLGEVPEGFYLHKLLYPSSRIEDIFVNLDKLLNLIKFAGVLN
jgi:tetratricopeptide (TPR) repeat protein